MAYPDLYKKTIVRGQEAVLRFLNAVNSPNSLKKPEYDYTVRKAVRA